MNGIKRGLLVLLIVIVACVLYRNEILRAQEPTITKTEEAHEPIPLRGYDGRELSIDSKEPYSPKHTCGECHEYVEITNGYHFQQGRTDGLGRIVISDNFNPKRPWHKSAGMFGKR